MGERGGCAGGPSPSSLNRGFSRAVIQECMFRLRDMGVRNAYIGGYSPVAIALYGSLGHVDELKCFVYEMAAT